MSILAINTASSKTAIALFEIIPGNKLKIIAEDSWPAENREAETLIPKISVLLKKIKKSFEDINRIYVIKGPGSFTGLRVGITVANTIAYLNKCKIFGISTFDYWHSISNLPLLIYAGSGGVYFSKNLQSKIELINLKELEKILKKEKIREIFGDITENQKKALGSIRFIEIKKTFAEIMQRIVEKNLHDKNLQSVNIVEPIYIKEPGITKSKKYSVIPAKAGI